MKNSQQRPLLLLHINRDILECKFHYDVVMPSDLRNINRDILECKYKYDIGD